MNTEFSLMIGQTYSKRAKAANNEALKKLFLLMDEKQTNLCLANDETNPEKMLENADKAGPEIAILKTHIDVVENFTSNVIEQLKDMARQHNFLIFEDRKFADIGNTVKMQYEKGIYEIAKWADLTNAHVVPGPGIIKGLKEVADTIDEPRGLILLAQMSSKGNLATDTYTAEAMKMAKDHNDFVIGFIGNGGDVSELKKLSAVAGSEFVILTPGVKLGGGGDKLGQRYTTPADVIAAGADVIIVGRGILGTEDQKKSAQEYRTAGWEAYQHRINK